MASIQIIHVGDTPRPTRTIRIGRPSFSEAIAERGLKEPKCRTFAQAQADLRKCRQDRPKHWPGDRCPTNYWVRSAEQKEVDAAHAALNAATDTVSYVKAWTLLNHLKEC
jgi:hypothetical protein